LRSYFAKLYSNSISSALRDFRVQKVQFLCLTVCKLDVLHVYDFWFFFFSSVQLCLSIVIFYALWVFYLK